MDLNSPIKKTTALILLVIFAWWTVRYVNHHLHEFSVITQVPLSILCILFLLFIGIIASNGITIKYILSAFGIHIGLKEFFSLSAVSSLTNYVTIFRGGAGVRALYLKSAYKLAFSDFLSTLSVMYLIHFLVNSIFGLIGMCLLNLAEVPFNRPLAALFALLLIFSAIGVFINVRLPEFRIFPLSVISRIINNWSLVRKDRSLLLKLIANNTAYAILVVLQTKVAFVNYDVNISWGSAMIFSAAKCLALLLTITPGSIGIVEWLSVYLGEFLGYSGSGALMAQTLMRVVSIATLALIFPFASRHLSRKV
ncbi:MAG: flippase-like domain-containing protein [Deltaproteobacteria bacterium]|nr:flippase-like domain-containing protein [Deltaproteobacteria bacterium]